MDTRTLRTSPPLRQGVVALRLRPTPDPRSLRDMRLMARDTAERLAREPDHGAHHFALHVRTERDPTPPPANPTEAEKREWAQRRQSEICIRVTRDPSDELMEALAHAMAEGAALIAETAELDGSEIELIREWRRPPAAPASEGPR